MSKLTIVLLVVLVGSLWVEAIDDSDTDEHWEAFKDEHNKTYSSPEEEEKRRGIFESNLLHVALHNIKDDTTYDKDIHQYSDMTTEEQIETLCGTDPPPNVESYPVEDFSQIAERAGEFDVDWNRAGKVSPVKDQKSCGSCYSFTAIQALESQYAINYNGMWTISPQHPVDCAKNYGNNGCNGGWPQNVFQFLMKENGGYFDSDYPYTAKEATCQTISNPGYRFRMNSFTEVGPRGDEDAVCTALRDKGPLTCAIYVGRDFMNYRSGIFKDGKYNGQQVNHGVLMTGCGSENGIKFFTIKNSWGPNWGEGGYMRIIRDGSNHLHIAEYTSYPSL